MFVLMGTEKGDYNGLEQGYREVIALSEDKEVLEKLIEECGTEYEEFDIEEYTPL